MIDMIWENIIKYTFELFLQDIDINQVKCTENQNRSHICLLYIKLALWIWAEAEWKDVSCYSMINQWQLDSSLFCRK